MNYHITLPSISCPHSRPRIFAGWIAISLAVLSGVALFRYIQNVQQQKQDAVQAEQTLVSVLRDTNTAMVEVNDHSRIISWNDAATKLFGFSAAEAMGADLSIILPDPTTALQHKGKVAYGMGERHAHVIAINCPAKHKSGAALAVSVRVYIPPTKTSAVALINNLTDITPVTKPISDEAMADSTAKSAEEK